MGAQAPARPAVPSSRRELHVHTGDRIGLSRRKASLNLFGGEAPVQAAIVDAFYDAVENDPVSAPHVPGVILKPPNGHLYLFLVQFFGGPRTYQEERGHPRLRMRHFPFRD